MTDDAEKEIEKGVEEEVAEQGFKLGIRHVAGPVIAAALAMSFHSIPSHEGSVLKATRDIAGIYTICGGISHVNSAMTATKAQCKALNETTIGKFMVQVAEIVPEDVNADTLAADTDFAYNVGIGTFKKSSVLALQKKGKYFESCGAFERYVCFHVPVGTGDRAGDCKTNDGHLQFSQGLKNRRVEERDQCLGVK